jgi:cytochrome-b5 reductase
MLSYYWHLTDIDQIAGGTGITAFTQLLHQALFSSQPVVSATGSKTHFTLLHSHRSPSQLPPQIITEDFELYHTNDSDRFTERVFVDNLDTEADDPPANISVGRIDKKTLENVLLERGILIDSSKGSITSLLSTKPAVKHLNPEKAVMVLVCGPEG